MDILTYDCMQVLEWAFTVLVSGHLCTGAWIEMGMPVRHLRVETSQKFLR